MAFQSRCKVCMSKHKNMIEQLSCKGFTPEKIHDYLQNLTDPMDRKIVKQEKLSPSSIRRHLTRHFDQRDEFLIKDAKIKSKVEKGREDFQQGLKINIDKANTLSHMVELALTRLEEVEQLSEAKKHQYTIGYMGQIKGLIDELNKISGNIKQEGTIDSNFFKNEITTFAEIVLSTIRALDIQYKMNFELEIAFKEEFIKQYKLYTARQDLIFAGKLSPKDGEKERNVNKFNDKNNLV